MSDTVQMILVGVFLYSAGGLYLWMLHLTDNDWHYNTIGQKTAIVIWCGPAVWLCALFWLLHKCIVNTVDKKFGEEK